MGSLGQVAAQNRWSRSRLVARFREPRARWSSAVFAAALLASVLIYRHLWADPTHRLLGSPNRGNDPMQMMWFLKWVPWALRHGHNPFRTDALLYPHGVQLTWNTFTPTLGVLAAPITMTAGAALSFAVLITLGPALTTLTGFWWLRRHTTSASAAAFGGLVVGFSPFVAGHMLGHLNLVFLALVPVLLMLVEDLLWRRPRSQRRTAAYLGITGAAQLGISEEVLLIVVIAAIATALIAAAILRRPAVAALRQAAAPFLAAVALCGALASPLLLWQLLSPHVTLYSQRFHAVVADYLHSGPRQVLSTADRHTSPIHGAEDGVYLGIAVIAVLVLGVVLTWRDRLVRIAALSMAVSILFTFGTDGLGPFSLVWRLIVHVPGLTAMLPARFALATSVAAAWLLTRWVDRLLSAQGTGAEVPTGRRPASFAAAVVIVGATVLTLAPRSINTSAAPPRAAFFGSHVEHRLLRPDAVLLVMPVPWPGDARAMYYQQLDDFRFRLPGGYALAPPSSYRDAEAIRLFGLDAAPPPGEAVPSLVQARVALRRIRPSAIAVLLGAPHADRWLAAATRLTGRGPSTVSGGVAVWTLRH